MTDTGQDQQREEKRKEFTFQQKKAQNTITYNRKSESFVGVDVTSVY